jgi:hypothetical protein
MGKNLGDNEHFVASSSNSFGDDLLSGARSIHLGGVDMRHAEIEAPAQCGDRRAALGGFDMPGPLTDRGYLVPGGTEPMPLHMFRWFGSDAGLFRVMRVADSLTQPTI